MARYLGADELSRAVYLHGIPCGEIT